MEEDKKENKKENPLTTLLKALLRFKRPRLAIVACMLAAFAITMALYPDAGVEKFGYMMAMGFGVGFMVAGTKAIMAEFGNLAVLLAGLGIAMVISGIFGTPDSVFAASALEEEATVILGAGLGFFSKLEEG